MEDMKVSTENLSKEEAIKEFLLDIDYLEGLNPWISKINLFDILKISKTEIRHSNILAWLLDANENHGIGDFFVRGMFYALVQENQNYFKSKLINILELLTIDFANFTLYREWSNIDIMLVSAEDKLVICIENKIESGEHDNQLERYQKKVESTYLKEEGYDWIYIYLTPHKDLASDIENWISFSYAEILDILVDTLKVKNLDSRSVLIIENYIETLRRYVVKDKELEEICISIYKKHKQALDLIFENRSDLGSVVSQILDEYLEERANNKSDILVDSNMCVKTIKRFTLPSFDQIFPQLPDVKGPWGNGSNYYCEIKFDINTGKLFVVFVVGNCEEYNEHKVEKLANLLNIKLKENWKWKTLESFMTSIVNQNQIEEFFEQEYDEIKKVIYEKLDKVIEKVLQYEKKIVQLWNEQSEF